MNSKLCHFSVIMALFIFLGPRSSDVPQVDAPHPEEHRRGTEKPISA